MQVFVDFHGHSRKKNIFMYGCSDRVKSKTSTDDDSQTPLHSNDSDNTLDNDLYSGSDVVKASDVIPLYYSHWWIVKVVGGIGLKFWLFFFLF